MAQELVRDPVCGMEFGTDFVTSSEFVARTWEVLADGLDLLGSQ